MASKEMSLEQLFEKLEKSIEMLEDATWMSILMKTGLSQELVRELFSVNRPLSNPRNLLQLV